MKRLVLLIVICLLSLGVTSCGTKEEVLTDALKFKEEYESVNGKSNDAGRLYRELSISEDNPFVYATPEEIVEKMDNGETFAVYFGFKTCPWCRSILNTLINVAKDLKLTKIYYVDVLDIRDTYSYDEEAQEVVRTKEGTEGYYKLLEAFNDVLSDYEISNNGKSISTNEKRIYAPNIVSVVKGKAESLTTGLSELQTDGYMELTDEMIQEETDKIKCVLDCLTVQACTLGC